MTKIRAALVVVAVALTTFATPASSHASTAGERVSVASAGCGQTPPPSGTRTITVDGTSRSYVLDVPSAYRRDTPAPVVFGLHGLGGTGSGFRSYSGLGAAMGADSILVYPSATGPIRAWDMEVDTVFFDAVLAQVNRLLCTNPRRVFATGHSMGAIFTNHLGCSRGDVLRAVAPVAGAVPPEGTPCVGQVAAWVAHGDNDGTVPFVNGVTTRDAWRDRNHCGTRTRPVGRGVEYEGCDAGHDVRWYAHSEGHRYPSWAAGEISGFFTSRK